MEGGTFLDRRLQEAFGRFVLIDLHTDGRTDEFRESSIRNRKLQKKMFKTTALPFYALLDPTAKTVYWKGGGRISEEDFLKFLALAPK